PRQETHPRAPRRWRAALGRDRGRSAGRVRDYPGRSVTAPARAPRERLRARAQGGCAAHLPGGLQAPAGGRRLARPVPALLGAEARRTRDRDRARQEEAWALTSRAGTARSPSRDRPVRIREIC